MTWAGIHFVVDVSLGARVCHGRCDLHEGASHTPQLLPGDYVDAMRARLASIGERVELAPLMIPKFRRVTLTGTIDWRLLRGELIYTVVARDVAWKLSDIFPGFTDWQARFNFGLEPVLPEDAEVSDTLVLDAAGLHFPAEELLHGPARPRETVLAMPFWRAVALLAKFGNLGSEPTDRHAPNANHLYCTYASPDWLSGFMVRSDHPRDYPATWSFTSKGNAEVPRGKRRPTPLAEYTISVTALEEHADRMPHPVSWWKELEEI